MSNTLVLTSEKKTMFSTQGNAGGGQLEIDTQGLFLSVVGDSFVNVENSDEFQDSIDDLLTKERRIAEYDISDSTKRHIINLIYNSSNRSVAIIGITDIDISMTDQQDTRPIEGIKTKGIGVKLMKTQVDKISFISNKTIYAREEREKLTTAQRRELKTNRKTRKIMRFYLLDRNDG